MVKSKPPVSVYTNYERMLTRQEFYGTILLSENMQYWWSPFRWYDPKYGLNAQPENWHMIGQSTFWADEKMKSEFVVFCGIIGDNLPMSPNEYYEQKEVRK